ncbi:MAG: hypothetical protein A2836_03035 [Candidatus Taylorbacteria bacterium RIFCSPHIGHO2_01_FULL_45_63]|uniref:Thioredoxin domain-containing protein n=1 Tax=Candidatus Taylorbacteria bacterium RIFCSPHIGHO2_02_FULL_45_35 TaxID=1802311 RepID=A0A1G2MXT6_9BACT|nr:MAG: hypothetical protein A2836_03035 [Candidatus Taylorbacteria bacterium RIFCSPHIGHO2_01_FULL_45_63]OHA28019.1 MAG: hypothetical protein A3D56_00285 [Candidatus Taylorbacteria bacterium RIFCSPHIGHO2_02_FULL_45_35]OHA34962.1 MAG: hypothetical protein A3A22_00245 [Candidatus Taylorbacteria bacterium RIFCSPLOWO2_01_FULL_45_34b]
MKSKQTLWWILVGVVVLALVYVVVAVPSTPGKYDTFATCLKDKGAIFYGAFWCQHCQNQKALFGKSAKLLPYVECSLPSGQGQTQICTDQKITGYPTWKFATGTDENGEVSLLKLSEKTGCPLPE